MADANINTNRNLNPKPADNAELLCIGIIVEVHTIAVGSK